jgi:dynein heavy chain
MWTAGSEDAIASMISAPFALEDWLKTNVDQIEVLTDLVRGELSDLKRRAIVSLITVDVHARDIIEELSADKIQSTNDFKWMK